MSYFDDDPEDDYYPDWAWQPVRRMPDGCNDVTVKYEDGRTREICSCDYWWSIHKEEEPPIQFRFT